MTPAAKGPLLRFVNCLNSKSSKRNDNAHCPLFSLTHFIHVIYTANAMTDVPDQHDGLINEREPKDEKCNFFWGLYKKIADDRPCIKEEDDVAKDWIEIAKCSRFSLLSPIFIVLLFVADVGMDCEVAATHYSRGDHRWAAYTLGVIVFSLIITDALSAFFYIEDQADGDKTAQLSRLNLNVKPWFYAIHFIFCGRILR